MALRHVARNDTSGRSSLSHTHLELSESMPFALIGIQSELKEQNGNVVMGVGALPRHAIRNAGT